MVTQCTEITLGVREKTLINVLLNRLALDFQRIASKLQQMIQARKEGLFATLEKVPQASAVDCHHTKTARLFSRTEQTVATLEKLTQIKLQAAAH